MRIGSSRIRYRLYLGLCSGSFYALFLLYLDGYTNFALFLFLPVIAMLSRLRIPAQLDSLLCWRQGVWTLEDTHQSRVIALGLRSTVLSWVIYIPFKGLPAGGNESLWIFPDSVPAEHWRKLRSRLNLEARQPTR